MYGCFKLSASIYAYTNTHTAYIHTHTYTYEYRRSSTRKYTYIKTRLDLCQHTQACMCQLSRIYPHTCIHAHILAHTNTCIHTHTHTLALTHKHLHTSARMLYNTYTCIKNKNAFTDITYIHTKIHSYANKSP